MARKSTSTGTVRARTRSERNGTLPFSTATSSTPSGKASEISAATRRTPSRSSSAVMSTLGFMPSGSVVLEGLPEQGGPQSLAQSGELRECVQRLLAGLRVSLLHPRQDDLLEETGLPLGRVLVHAQVAGLHAEALETGAQVGDYQGLLVVVHGVTDLAAVEQPEPLQV